MLLEGCVWATLVPGNVAVAQGYPAWRPSYPAAFPFPSTGVDSHAGMNGIGFDVATPLTRRFKIRARGDLLGYGPHVALNRQEYPSSPTDPLHGSGSVDFRGVGYAF
jgi:hypothetical protein